MSDSVGSVSVEVVPDARGWSEKLRAQIGNTTANIKADADTTEASAQLDEAARTRTATIKADVSQLSKANNVVGSFADKLGVLPALAIAGTAALIPFTAAIGGVAAALAAPLVIAAGGAGIFAVLGGLAVKQTEKQLKNIDALHKKLTGLTKGTATYNDTLKQLNAAQGSLTPGQVKFADATDKLKLAFQGLLSGENGQSLLGPITQGIEALAKILPAAEPLIRSVSGAFSTLITDVSKAASGPGFDRFMQMFSRQAGGDIVGFGHIIGNITTGLGGLFGALDKQAGHSLVDELGHLTGEFSHWANSKAGRQDVRAFLDYFHQVGPQVAHTIAAVGRALGQIVQALAPLGPVVLSGLTHAANALSAIPLPVLTALAAATVGLAGFNKLGGFKATGFAINKLTSGQGGLGGLIGAAKPVPVFVTNPGFGGVPGVPVPGGGPGGKVPLTTVAGDVGATGGLFARYLGKGGLSKILGDALAAPALVTLGDAHNETGTTKGIANVGTPVDVNHVGNLKDFQRVTGTASLKSTGTALDAVRAAVATTSRGFDVMGHSAAANSASVTHSLKTVAAALSGLPSVKQLNVVARTADAIHSLERLQALTIRDKSFNVIQNNIERTLGPGGGMQHHALGGLIRGAGSGSSDSIASWLSNGEFVVNASATSRNRALLEQLNRGTYHASRSAVQNYMSTQGSGGGAVVIHTHVNLDSQQIAHVVTPIAEQSADRVYHVNRGYEDARAGR